MIFSGKKFVNGISVMNFFVKNVLHNFIYDF